MSNNAEPTHGALELVVFKLVDGADRDRFIEAADLATAWIETQPGFVSRDLSYSPSEDRWVEIVWWRSMEEAEAASAAAMTSESCIPMFSMVDLDSALMLHGEPALRTVDA